MTHFETQMRTMRNGLRQWRNCTATGNANDAKNATK
jgi:hypothetical protein